MQRGDIFNVDLPPESGEKPGHEQIGGRPAIIVQYGSPAANLSTILIVPFTKVLKRQSRPGAFVVQPSPENGLSFPSVALTDQLRALSLGKILNQRGKLSASELQRLSQALKSLLNL